MKAKEKKILSEVIECEGFEYTFLRYSGFEDIKDKRFHELRNTYLTSIRELADYLGVDP